jgi:RNA polymerase sigma-70 factor (ECF subfamily)
MADATMAWPPAIGGRQAAGEPADDVEPGSESGAAARLAGLVRAARDGDRTAFGALYERYARVVHGILLAHVPADDAADLVHDVFLAAMRQLHALRDPGAFGAWLATIARNRARMHHRQGAGREMVPLSEDLAGRAAPPDDSAEAVLAAIRRLPEAYRETLLLRLVEGLTGPEIAERTGLTPGSVRVNLHRGMQRLRALLGGPETDA